MTGQGEGVERQLEDCRQLAKERGLDVIAELSDNDISASTGRKRQGYDKLLKLIHEGSISAVVAWNADRLHRRTTELEAYITACQPRDIQTFTVKAGHVDMATAAGRMTARVVGAVAQQESEQKAERIARQKLQAAKQGKFLGGRVPFGWRRVDAVKVQMGSHVREVGGSVVVFEPEAELVREGTRMILAGRNLLSVVRMFEESGQRSLSGKYITTGQVKRLLVRDRNAGIVTYHGEIVNDSWPAIVSLEDLRHTQAILNDPARSVSSQYRYLLSGILKCTCGQVVNGSGNDKAGRKYRCSVNGRGGHFERGHVNRQSDPIDAFVRSLVAAYLRRDDVQAAICEAQQQHQAQASESSSGEVAELHHRKAALVRMFASGELSEVQMLEGNRVLDSKLGEIEKRLRKVVGPDLSATVVAKDPGEAFLSADVDQQRAIVGTICDVQFNRTPVIPGAKFDPASVNVTWKVMGN